MFIAVTNNQAGDAKSPGAQPGNEIDSKEGGDHVVLDDKTSHGTTPSSPKVPNFATRAPGFLDSTDPVVWKSAIGVGLTVIFVVFLLIVLTCWRMQKKKKSHVMRKTSFRKWNEEVSVIKVPVPMMKSKCLYFLFSMFYHLNTFSERHYK